MNTNKLLATNAYEDAMKWSERERARARKVIQNMHQIIHQMLDISARIRANYWSDLEHSECVECGYGGESESA